jgi:hypothetical protein
MKNRTFFWPFVMIATGFVWLLINLGTISSDNLWALTQVWPYLLMILGVGLIVRSFWRSAGMLFSGLIVLGAVLSVLYAPQFGWNKPASWAGIAQFNVGSEFGGGVDGSGVVVSEKREVSSFTAIEVRYPAEVVIKQAEVNAVTVETDDNLLPQLSTRISNGTLVIENKVTPWNKRVNPSNGIKITISVKDLRSVDFPSAGKVTIEGIRSESLKLDVSGAGSLSLVEVSLGAFDVNLSGAGSIEAQGTTDSLNVEISGAGSFTGSDLKANTADANISGVGSCELWVVDDLTANISGLGSINYYGSPKVHKNVSGLGNVNSLGQK